MKNKFDGYVIFSDLDGTLLNDNKEVSKENKKAIEYFIENGGKFSIATGRAIDSVSKYIESVKTDLPIITYNGGTIYDYNKKKIISEKVLDKDKKALACKIADDYENIGVEIYVGKDVYVLKDNGVSDRQATRLLNLKYDVPENIFNLSWNKITTVGKIGLMDEVESEFYNKYKTKAIRSGECFVEIVPDNASKGDALNEIIKTYNLDKKKVICAGDNMNDLELLMEAGISFCPENASNEVKKYANHITVNNNEHIIPNIIKWIETNL